MKSQNINSHTRQNQIDKSFCEKLADDGMFHYVRKKTAKACETAYPDEYIADYVGRRKVKLWYVSRTFAGWWNTTFR